MFLRYLVIKFLIVRKALQDEYIWKRDIYIREVVVRNFRVLYIEPYL